MHGTNSYADCWRLKYKSNQINIKISNAVGYAFRVLSHSKRTQPNSYTWLHFILKIPCMHAHAYIAIHGDRKWLEKGIWYARTMAGTHVRWQDQ